MSKESGWLESDESSGDAAQELQTTYDEKEHAMVSDKAVSLLHYVLSEVRKGNTVASISKDGSYKLFDIESGIKSDGSADITDSESNVPIQFTVTKEQFLRVQHIMSQIGAHNYSDFVSSLIDIVSWVVTEKLGGKTLVSLDEKECEAEKGPELRIIK